MSQELSHHFGNSKSYWKSKFINGRKDNDKYVDLFQNISKGQLDLLREFPLFELGRYSGGLIAKRSSRREKPFKNLCFRTIGLDRKGSKVGLEHTFDKFLRGDTTKVLKQRFHSDLWLPVYQPTKVGKSRGADIVTSLDMRIQGITHDELLSVLNESDAERGTAIVMEVSTGAIKAMVNLSKNQNGSYSENYSHGVGRLTEPGSTFKLMSALAMLEDGVVDLDTEININGGVKKFYNQTMRDSEMHGTKTATFQEVFEMSSNVGMGVVAFEQYKADWKAFYDSLKELRIMKRSGIEINREPNPFFKNPSVKDVPDNKKWSGTTIPWMAHGYELEMTPLQVLNVYNTVANDGRMMRPHLVTEIVRDGKTIRSFKPQVLKEQIVGPSTVMKAQKLLKGVAERGTAKKLNTKDISFAGKTGTTKVEYWTDKKEYNASFAGYFPQDNPKYSMIVVVYNPKGAYYGAQVAGPVFRDVVKRLSGMEELFEVELEEEDNVLMAQAGYGLDYKRLLSEIGVSHDSGSSARWVEMEGKDNTYLIDKKKISSKKVSDLRGMGLRDAMYVLESLGMEVEVVGAGKVYKQSLAPGTRIQNKKIKIFLK